MVSAAKEIDEAELDWDMTERLSDYKTKWVFCPSGALFRNVVADSFVKKVKKTLSSSYGGRLLTYHELETALKRAACILNLRPISVVCCRKGGVDPDYIQALTPNMMLLGRSNQDVPIKDYEDADSLLARLVYLSELKALFWDQLKVQDRNSTHRCILTSGRCYRGTLPWGKLVLIIFTSKSKFGEYRLGRVVAMEMDDDKLARTVLVKYSLIQHMSRKDRLSYKGIQIKNIRVAVQWLFIILR